MNKAITDGIVFQPPAFSAGLGQWSRGDGVPGSNTYANIATAAFVPADQDFAGCLEVQKTDTVQKLRYMGQTPILPGCYLRITARVKAVSGALPEVRIAGWAGNANDNHVGGVPETGASVPLTAYGEVVEVSAIVGTGNRGGVDLVWGSEPVYGHFGLDLTGANGGIVRIDDIAIEDVTGVFLRDMVSVVDVRDFGAVGDGTTNDSAAFTAANEAAQGREVLVSEGTYYLGSSVQFDNRVRFEGQVVLAEAAILSLTKNYDLPTYIDAFGGDEEQALKEAIQALMNNAEHESLDLGGRRISIHGPIDVRSEVPNRSIYAQRRVIRNGQLRAESSGAWTPTVVTSQASYTDNNKWRLTNVTNIANIPVGSLVQAAGVGREVYVREVNIGAQEITLSQPLFDAEGTQSYTFTRYKYMLDFAGFEQLKKFELEGIEFQCNAEANGIILAPTGSVNVVRNCVINQPKHRCITSPGDGCQGLIVEGCQFLTSEGGDLTQNRVSIGINTNANDVKIRNNRASQFRHFLVVSGGQSLITGNHMFQGDDGSAGVRSAGIVITVRACNAQISNNYIDNCHVEWTNERETDPNHTGGFGFAGLSITNNVMYASHTATWFSFVVIRPYGTDNFINGVNITGNTFRSVGGVIDRVERVDTTYAPLDLSRMRSVDMSNNTFHNIDIGASNPCYVEHDQNSHAQTWTVDTSKRLPFGGFAREVESLVMRSRPRDTNNVSKYHMPYVETQKGTLEDKVHVIWPEPMRGDIRVRVLMDK